MNAARLLGAPNAQSGECGAQRAASAVSGWDRTNSQVARANVPVESGGAIRASAAASNNNFARGNGSNVNNHATTSGSQQGSNGTLGCAQLNGSAAAGELHLSRAQRNASSSRLRRISRRRTACVPEGNSGSHNNSGNSNSHGSSTANSRASGSAPRPPAGYSYHAAPAYSGSSSYAAGRSGTSVYGGRSPGPIRRVRPPAPAVALTRR